MNSTLPFHPYIVHLLILLVPAVLVMMILAEHFSELVLDLDLPSEDVNHIASAAAELVISEQNVRFRTPNT